MKPHNCEYVCVNRFHRIQSKLEIQNWQLAFEGRKGIQLEIIIVETALYKNSFGLLDSV